MKLNFRLEPNQYLLFCWIVGLLGIDNKIDYKGCYKVVRYPYVSFTISKEDLEKLVKCIDETLFRFDKLFSNIEIKRLYELEDVLNTYLDSYK
jgi:hypothetical protein